MYKLVKKSFMQGLKCTLCIWWTVVHVSEHIYHDLHFFPTTLAFTYHEESSDLEAM